MRRIRFRVVLPVAVLAVTIGLLVWAHVEEQEFWSPKPSKAGEWDGGWDFVMAWDYMPSGRRLALNLNFPIALVYPPLHPYLRDHAQMGPPPPHYQVPLVLLVPLLWYWVGRGLDRYRGPLPYDRRSPRGPILSGFLWLGLLLSVLILGITTLAFVGGYVPVGAVFPGSAFWSLGFLIHSLRQLYRRPLRLRATG